MAPWNRTDLRILNGAKPSEDRSKGERIYSPRETGDLSSFDITGVNHNVRQDIIVENLKCPGTPHCAIPCEAQVKVSVSSFEQVNIYMLNHHNQVFPGASGNNEDLLLIITAYTPLPQLTKKQVEALLTLDMKPITALVHIRKMNLPGIQTLTIEKVRDIKRTMNRRVKSMGDAERVQLFLQNVDRSNGLVVFPPPEEVHKIVPGEPWKVILSHKELLKGLRDHGSKIIGMDSVYKLCRVGYGVYVIIFVHGKTKESVIAGIGVLSEDTTDSIEAFVKFFKEKVKEITPEQGDFTPSVMIDKDYKELTALQRNQLRALLCNFHAMVALLQRVNLATPDQSLRNLLWGAIKRVQRSKNPTELLEASVNFMEVAMPISKNFAEYFRDHWLNPDWAIPFSDIWRLSLEGLWSTNNHTEAVIKTLNYSFFGNVATTTVFKLLSKLAAEVIPYYADRLKKLDSGTVPRKSNPSTQAFPR
jgi:hypothetical protein